nr:PD-(D/E)XK nuclease-like domain-containing protein [uncultured Oscillibacter sp.]
MSLPIVTAENYFSPEIQMAYMGASQFKAFDRCEAAALAELLGDYTPPSSTALLVGSYVDAYFSGSLPLYQAQHPELFKRDGNLKAEYVHAQDIIARMESDELYTLLTSGQKQIIRTGEIAGVPFKIKIDSLLDADTCRTVERKFPNTSSVFAFCDGAIVDQKVMRDMADVWSEEERRRVPFVEAWGYDFQGAIYQAVEGHMLPFILAVGTKEASPDLAALYISDADLSAKLAEVEDRAPRYQAIKEGREQPRRCEHCDYCKATRKLTAIRNYKDLAEE